jgi:putative DNA methylase
LYFGTGVPDGSCSTRHAHEVQDTEAEGFAKKLKRVFCECHRVLRDDGLLVFSYHHSREDGWSTLARAVMGAGFTIVQSQPVKAEMSVAAPKSQTKEPIDLDVLLVCRKRESDFRLLTHEDEVLQRAVTGATQKVIRFNKAGRRLSRGDVRVVLLSQLLVESSKGRTADEVDRVLEALLPQTRGAIEMIWRGQDVRGSTEPIAPLSESVQLTLFGPATGATPGTEA